MQSEIRNMSIECEKVGGINLSQGVCDTGVPEPVRRAAQQAIEDGLNSYTRHDGIAELRSAKSARQSSSCGLKIFPVGFPGALTIRPRVRGVTAFSSAAGSKVHSGGRIGTYTGTAPTAFRVLA